MPHDKKRPGAAPGGDPTAQLLRDLPCGIAVSDADGRLEYCNQTLTDWLGQKFADLSGRPHFSSILTVPSRIFMQTHVTPMLRLQGFVREISCQLLREGDDPLPVLLNAVLRRDAEGTPRRIDYSIFDATERSIYEAQLREARREAEELAAIVRSAPNPILRVSADGRVQAWNAKAEEQLGHAANEAVGREVEDLIILSDSEHWFAGHRGFADFVFEALHEDGQEFEITIAPIGAEPGRDAPPDYSVVFRDITDRKKSERHLRLMVREMDHRVKNTLAVVNAIARQTLPATENRTFIQRLLALTRAHDALTEAHWDVVDLKLLLRMIQAEAGGVRRLSFEGPAVTLQPRQLTALSMVFHELITNALKYGALSRRRGRVEVTYGIDATETGTRLWLDWVEHGGPPANEPAETGFGSRMIRLLLQSEFNGSITTDFAAAGLRCRLALQLQEFEK